MNNDNKYRKLARADTYRANALALYGINRPYDAEELELDRRMVNLRQGFIDLVSIRQM